MQSEEQKSSLLQIQSTRALQYVLGNRRGNSKKDKRKTTIYLSILLERVKLEGFSHKVEGLQTIFDLLKRCVDKKSGRTIPNLSVAVQQIYQKKAQIVKQQLKIASQETFKSLLNLLLEYLYFIQIYSQQFEHQHQYNLFLQQFQKHCYQKILFNNERQRNQGKYPYIIYTIMKKRIQLSIGIQKRQIDCFYQNIKKCKNVAIFKYQNNQSFKNLKKINIKRQLQWIQKDHHYGGNRQKLLKPTQQEDQRKYQQQVQELIVQLIDSNIQKPNCQQNQPYKLLQFYDAQNQNLQKPNSKQNLLDELLYDAQNQNVSNQLQKIGYYRQLHFYL